MYWFGFRVLKVRQLENTFQNTDDWDLLMYLILFSVSVNYSAWVLFKVKMYYVIALIFKFCLNCFKLKLVVFILYIQCTHFKWVKYALNIYIKSITDCIRNFFIILLCFL